MINDILDFSKIEAGKLELDAVRFDLHDTLDITLKALSVRAHRKGLELICRVDPDVPGALIGDDGRLGQVINNLVGNAVKFTAQGEVEVDVDIEHEDTDHVLLHVCVRDTGIGIAADRQAAVFKAFEQADSSTTRRYGGTGLGLGISTRLVTLMGGRLWLESALGVGSTFHFTARLARAMGPATVATAPVELDAMRVLIVDDNATNRSLLIELLERWKLRPTAVESPAAARAACAAATDDPFRLALVDVCMPDEDGWSLAAWFNERPEPLRVVMMSSASEQGGARRARELGVAGFLLKPLGQRELLRALSPVAVAAVPTASRDAGMPRRAARPGLRVLVAEDNPVNRELVLRLLQKHGDVCTLAVDGRAALDRWQAAPFDLVLMDVQMPEMDGFEVTAAIRLAETTRGGRVPIIALTAHAMQGDVERCLAAGMDGYLGKPLRSRELFALLDGLAPIAAAA
ncbi:MAG: response regulator [Casimicrobiaceae bacterium]